MLRRHNQAVALDELFGLRAGEEGPGAHGNDSRAWRTVLVCRAELTRVERLLCPSVVCMENVEGGSAPEGEGKGFRFQRHAPLMAKSRFEASVLSFLRASLSAFSSR